MGVPGPAHARTSHDGPPTSSSVEFPAACSRRAAARGRGSLPSLLGWTTPPDVRQRAPRDPTSEGSHCMAVGLRPPSDHVLHEGEHWYAVYAQPHWESTAQLRLRAQNFRTFLPLHSKTVHHAR